MTCGEIKTWLEGENDCLLGCCAVQSGVSLPIALMMEAASTSETSVNFYRTTRRQPYSYSPPWEPEISHGWKAVVTRGYF
jgi:hypothetical protein